MKKFLLMLVALFTIAPAVQASVGINAGLGIPFVSQYGLNVTFGPKVSMVVGYNVLDLSAGEASVKLSMPEVTVNWHPFAGSFFLGLGVGQEKLEVTATSALTAATASADVTATTSIMKLGWMWGKADGGFWFGMDVAYIMPSGGKVDVEATGGLGTTSQEYQDVVDAGEQFGKTAYANITFARLGYLF